MSTFGTVFRVTTFGESHCAGVGAVVDGCPAGLALTEADLQPQLSRRRPGQSALTTKVPAIRRCRVDRGTGSDNGARTGTGRNADSGTSATRCGSCRARSAA